MRILMFTALLMLITSPTLAATEEPYNRELLPLEEATRLSRSFFTWQDAELILGPPATICFKQADTCLFPQPELPPSTGPCNRASSFMSLQAESRKKLTSRVFHEGFMPLPVALKAARRYGAKPQVYYSICEDSALYTTGTLCLGPQNAEVLTVCTYVREDRTRRSPYPKPAITQ